MTEREVKNKNPFKDHILESILGKKNSDSKDEFLANGFENQNSLPSENSKRKINDNLIERNSVSEEETCKNSTAPEYFLQNRELNELQKIPEKSKRNFKSMTLDRMGKMLKIKSTNSNQSETETKNKEQNENQETRTIFYPYDQPLSKEKTNSLGRVFKLMDHDINPRRLFGHSSVTKLAKKTKFTNDEKISKHEHDPIRRVFSKVISQIKGRQSKSEKTPAEPNIRSSAGEEKSKDSHPASRTSLATRIISSLSSSPSRLSVIKKSTPLTHDPTSSTSGIP